MNIGSIFAVDPQNIPEGAILCNGQAVSREQYSALFKLKGTVFGKGDGETTFNVPDLTGDEGFKFIPQGHWFAIQA